VFLSLESKRGVEGVADSLRIVGKAMIMTTLTTIVGFLSFTLLPAHGIKQLGLYASMGIGYAAISTWIFLPVVLPRVNIKGHPRHGEERVFFKVSKLWKLVVMIFLIVALVGIPFLRVHFSLLSIYRSWTKVRKNFEEVMEKTGFGVPIFAIGNADDPLSPQNAEKVLKLERELEENGYVKYAFAVFDILEGMGEKLYKKKGYPKNAKFLMLLLNRADKKSVESLIKGSSFRIIMSVDDNAPLEKIEEVLKSHGMKVTGVPYILEDLNSKVISSQLKSILMAMILVWVMILIMIRHLRNSLVSLIPISITILTLFGFMGYVKIPLNVTTAIMSGLVIGVGIDYAIHYAALQKKFKREEALRRASTPIMANAFGLAIGYTPMVFSPLMIHLYLSAIMWVTMISSAFLSLVILPNVLKD
jgi:predicted RND superfamily exporter protein